MQDHKSALNHLKQIYQTKLDIYIDNEDYYTKKYLQEKRQDTALTLAELKGKILVVENILVDIKEILEEK